jgi:hypothetical protein
VDLVPGLLVSAAALALVNVQGHTQAPRFVPKLDPVAETKLVMEGLALPNFKGLERHLGQAPKDNQAWTYARGQALLIAETANLLLIRPPRNQGQDRWLERATELRTSAAQLAQSLALKDFEGSRTRLASLAASCNRCHQTFRVQVQIAPFQDGPAP